MWAQGAPEAGAAGEDWCKGGVAEDARMALLIGTPLRPPSRCPSGREIIRGVDRAGGGGDWGRDRSLGRGSLPQLAGRGWRPRSQAAGGHFSCGAAESPSCPPRPQSSTVSRPAPIGGRSPPRAGRGGERPRGQASREPGFPAAGLGPVRGRRVRGIRAEERAGGEKGEGGSRYLYWAAAAAAAAPLWVNPK